MKFKSTMRVMIFGIIAVLMLSFVGAVSSPAGAVPADQSFSASLQPIAGLVQYLPQGKTAWVTLKDIQLVSKGDQVRTGSNGFARLSVVTGIEVEIYPTTQVLLNDLATGQDVGQVFDLTQIVGTLFTNVKQAVKSADRVQIILPNAGVSVKGTQFLTFVSPNLHSAVFSQQGNVEVQGADKATNNVTTDNFIYINTGLPATLPTTCDVNFLTTNTKAMLINIPINSPQSKVDAIRAFLTDFVNSNLNPLNRAFLRNLLGLPSVDFSKITAQDDDKEFQEILTGIAKLDVSKLNLQKFLQSYRDFYLTTYKGSLSSPLAPISCGTSSSTGKTATTCPDDFTQKSSCGNGICETNRVGGVNESVVSCPADCLPKGDLGLTCANAIDSLLNPGKPISGQPTPNATHVPTYTKTPLPSGVGQ